MGNTYSNPLGNNGGRFYGFANKPAFIDWSFVVDSTNGNGLGVRSVKGAGVQNVFMHTSASAGKGANGYLNPNPAAGYALIQLNNNYPRYLGGFSGFSSPVTGSSLAINSTALTIGNPYVITSVGHATAGTVSIAPVADVSGSLASTWFRLYDGYGQTFVIWFYVTGVGGSAPLVGPGSILVQQTIAENASAATIGGALASTINLLQSSVSGVYSFTATGTTTVTVVSTQTNPYGPLPGAPSDGAIATGFTFVNVDYNTNNANWRAVGMPVGVTENIGVSFIATATGSSTGGGSTGTVMAPGISGITSIEVIGDPSQSFGLKPFHGSPNVGGFILVQFLAPTSSSTTTLVPTAPANNTVVGMSCFVDVSSTSISGD